MKLFELAYACRLYGELTDFDKSYENFINSTKPQFDMSNFKHRKALLIWLNSWGCRQFAVNYHDHTSSLLEKWYKKYLDRLPPSRASLDKFSDIGLTNASILYGSLQNLTASYRRIRNKKHRVKIGPTGAAKILFALRKCLFPPWDTPIRKHFGYDESPESYETYLRDMRNDLQNIIVEAAKDGIQPNEIPPKLGRFSSSLVKLIDEYNWIVYTKGYKVPTYEEVVIWKRWADL